MTPWFLEHCLLLSFYRVGKDSSFCGGLNQGSLGGLWFEMPIIIYTPGRQVICKSSEGKSGWKIDVKIIKE